MIVFDPHPGYQDYQNTDLTDHCFDSQKLDAFNFAGANLGDCKFNETVLTNCDLRRAKFTSSTLMNCTFYNCQLKGAIFQLTNLTAATFSNLNLDGVDFTRAILLATRFNRVSLLGVKGLRYFGPLPDGRMIYAVDGNNMYAVGDFWGGYDAVQAYAQRGNMGINGVINALGGEQ